MKLRYKYRIYPNKQQEQQMISVGGSSRFVFNYFLKQNINQYQIDKKFIWHFDMNKKLTHVKKQFTWLYDTYNAVLQSSLRDLDQSLKNIKHGAGFPKFKSKYTTPIKFKYPRFVSIVNNQLRLPKIGDIKIVFDRDLPKFTGCTIYKTPRGWYASFVVDKEEIVLCNDITNSVGIDVNSDYTALSTGELITNLKPLKSKSHKIKQLQRQLARKKKGSKNRIKSKIKLARLHDQIRCQRHYHIHQISSRITKAYDLVSVETLKINEMRKNHYAAKAIQDVGWAMFITAIKYKSKLLGHHFVKISQWLPSSKTCSNCGEKKQSLDLKDRQFVCDTCNLSIHRDINAAININNYGIQQWTRDHARQLLSEAPVDVVSDLLTCWGEQSATSTKQEILV